MDPIAAHHSINVTAELVQISSSAYTTPGGHEPNVHTTEATTEKLPDTVGNEQVTDKDITDYDKSDQIRTEAVLSEGQLLYKSSSPDLCLQETNGRHHTTEDSNGLTRHDTAADDRQVIYLRILSLYRTLLFKNVVCNFLI